MFLTPLLFLRNTLMLILSFLFTKTQAFGVGGLCRSPVESSSIIFFHERLSSLSKTCVAGIYIFPVLRMILWKKIKLVNELLPSDASSSSSSSSPCFMCIVH